MINITNLSSTKNGKGFIFSDLNLNFEEKKVSGNFRNGDVAPGNDLVIDYDVDAIKNSIRNLLFQKRYLTNVSANLKMFIGQPMSEMNAIALGENIERAITLFEPRVKIEKIYVIPNIERFTYYIYMAVRILNLNVVTTLNASFDRNGAFEFVNT